MALLKRKTLSFVALLIAFLFAPFHLVQKMVVKDLPLTGMAEVYAKVLTSMEEVLGKFFKDGEEITQETKTLSPEQLEHISERAHLNLEATQDLNYLFYVARKDGEVTGYAAQDAVPGKWGSIHYAILISPEGKVKKVVVTEYQEKRGKPVAKNRFLKQFRGKSVKSKLRLMKDIKGVTGASMSSSGMTNGVRKMVHVFDAFYGGGA